MSITPENVPARVIRVIAEALDHPTTSIKPWSSLIDDLGAESIDFLDIAFRLESEFGIKVNSEELWAGRAGKLTEADAIEAEVARLRERMPEFPWDRFHAKLTKADLPRLITTQTVIDYVGRRLTEHPEGAASA
jgi:acyl carrier protein